MRVHVGVIRRAVDGEIQGHLHAPGVDLFHQPVEVLQGAQLRGHVLVAAAVGAVLVPVADGVGHARFARLAGHGVVAAFARRDADGVDGGEINHVKPHGFRVVHAPQAIPERGAPVAPALGGPREKLVPLGEKRALPVHRDPRITGVFGGGVGGFLDE